MRKLTIIIFVCVLLCSGALAAEDQAVTILIDAGHAPYTYVQDGEPRGVGIELLREVFRNTPYRLVFAEPTPMQLARLHEHGEYGVAGFYPLPSESGRYVRSDMLFTLTHGLYSRKDYPRVTVANASETKIGIRSESYLTVLAASHLGVTEYVSYDTVQEGVEMLLAGEADVLFEEEAAINGALDALGAWERIRLQQSALYRTSVHVVLPGEMAAYIDVINSRVAQVRASGMAARLSGAAEQGDNGAEDSSDAMVYLMIGVMAILFVIGIIVARSFMLAPMRTLEAISEAYPLLAVNDAGEITFINEPARVMFSDFKLIPAKKFARNERLENAYTGLSIDLTSLESEPDVLLLKDEIIHWRGALDVRRVMLGAQSDPSALIRFTPLSLQAQQRGFVLLGTMIGAQGSFAALCQGVYNVLEVHALATAMGVYTPNGVEGVEPLFETFSSAARRGVFALLYRAVNENGFSVLLPEEITELAARCGVRYNEQARFIAAPLTTDNEMAGMLFLRLRMRAGELSAAELEMLHNVAWRLSMALQRFSQEARTHRFAWYDSDMHLPNAAYFEQLLRRFCGESVSAPTDIQAEFKELPSAGAVAIVRVSPANAAAMDAIAKMLAGKWRAARLNDEMFGLLIDETDTGALEQMLTELKNELLSGLDSGVSLYFGAARFPFDALSADSLINLTRLALTKAKRNSIAIHGG